MLKDYLHKMDIVLLILMVAGLVYVVNCVIEIFNHRKRMKTVLPHTKNMIILSINRELYAMFEILTPMIFAIIIKLISWGWVDKL